MAKAKKSSPAKRSAPVAKRSKTTAKKSLPRKAVVKTRKEKPRKAAPRKKIASVKPAKKKVAAPVKKSGKPVRTAAKKVVGEKTVTRKPSVGSKNCSTKGYSKAEH